MIEINTILAAPKPQSFPAWAFEVYIVVGTSPRRRLMSSDYDYPTEEAAYEAGVDRLTFDLGNAIAAGKVSGARSGS